MMGRPSVAAALAVALLATLTVSAFALSLPAVTGPQARDLPRIVSDVGSAPTTSAVASPTAPVAPAQPDTSTSANAGSGSSGGSAGTKASSSPGGRHNGSGASDHEVVEPKLHESDGDNEGSKSKSDSSNATPSNGIRAYAVLGTVTKAGNGDKRH